MCCHGTDDWLTLCCHGADGWMTVSVLSTFCAEEPADTVEGGNYISSEFQLGQVYMGEEHDLDMDRTIIYRPVYVTLRASRPPSVCGRSTSGSRTNLLQVSGSL